MDFTKHGAFNHVSPSLKQIIMNYKFRAYNKESKTMYYPESTQEEFNHYLQIGSGGFWLYDKDGKLLIRLMAALVASKFTACACKTVM
jgi:hypothetical protein